MIQIEVHIEKQPENKNENEELVYLGVNCSHLRDRMNLRTKK